MKKLVLLPLILMLSSCILVPVIDSFKKAGLTENDRKALLPPNLKKFHDSLHWGSINDAMVFVAPENASEISDYLNETSEEQKIVESKIKSVKFDEGAYTATVEVKTRAYKIPVYIVTDKTERETWKCSFGNDWKLAAIVETTTTKK